MVTFHFSHNEHGTITMDIHKDGHSLGTWMIESTELSRMWNEIDYELHVYPRNSDPGECVCEVKGKGQRDCPVHQESKDL